MLGTLVPIVVGTITSTSAGIAIDSLTKILTPPSVKAITGFGIKMGSVVVSGIVSAKISAFAVKNTEAIVEIVNNTVEEIEETKL